MPSDVTRLLALLDAGDRAAADELFPRVYAELHALAAARMAHERPGATLDATALVHEAWLRLAGSDAGPLAQFDGARHFFGAAAEAMRRILVERARARAAEKRGGGRARVELDPELAADARDDAELLDLDAALVELARVDARKARLVELRYFAGLSLDDAARSLGIAPATADRDWAFARAWLFARLSRCVPADVSSPPESSDRSPE
ncbi:MAG: ECF-type sigma factor [Planctomycetes bacterium]|nr:ECF-type sigma factor [Planctomycetota bacterium]